MRQNARQLPTADGYVLIFFREGVLGLIPGEALGEGSALLEFASLQGIQVFMCFQFALGSLHRCIDAGCCYVTFSTNVRCADGHWYGPRA